MTRPFPAPSPKFFVERLHDSHHPKNFVGMPGIRPSAITPFSGDLLP